MAQRDDKKRLGKKHRQASTRPKKGRAPRVTPTTGAVDPRKRKALATKRAALEKKKRTPTRSPEHESRKTLAPKPHARSAASPAAPTPRKKQPQPADHILGRQTPHSTNIGRTESADAADTQAWREAELLAAGIQPTTSNLQPATALP